MAVAMAPAPAVSMRTAWAIGVIVVLLASHAADAATVGACDDPEARAPNTGQEWFALGDALYAENRYRESIAAFERALQLHVANAPEAAGKVARGYARLGNRKQTLRWLAHAHDMGLSQRTIVRRDFSTQLSRSAGTFPPFSDIFFITCLCSQMFMVAESFVSPV